MEELTSVHIIVDALDESDVDVWTSLLGATDGLSSLTKASILWTSRPRVDIAGYFKGSPTVNIRAADVDIEAYIKKHKDTLPHFVRQDVDLVARICHQVMQATDGLHIMLSVCGGLVEAADPHGGSQHRAPMAEILPEVQLVHFVHYTVQEYFHLTAHRWFPNSARTAAAACITYLSYDCFKERPREDSPTAWERDRFHAWLEYAARHWHDHWREVENEPRGVSCRLRDEALAFLSDPNSISWVHKAMGGHWSDAWLYHPRAIGLHIVARYGLPDLLDSLIAAGQRGIVNVQDAKRATPLCLAALHRHTVTVCVLLRRGANIDVRHEQEAIQFIDVLQAACYGGCRRIVQLLIQNGANVSAQGGQYGNSLQIAAEKGDLAMVELLLANNANVNALGGIWGSALQAASYNCHVELVRLLLLHGAEANVPGGIYGTALVGGACATENYSEAILLLLLEHGADVNTPGRRSALHAACAAENEATIRLLLQRGADVNAQDEQHRNPLHRLTNSTIARMLLEAGAADTRDGEYDVLLNDSLRSSSSSPKSAGSATSSTFVGIGYSVNPVTIDRSSRHICKKSHGEAQTSFLDAS
ncbi:hypothetical protein LTR10_010218 [Elasticomyces elasticus]|nr:hypothetical protein LTR10_010218 [Elasticomyces elasticus]KAK4972122.1 hypothetical protein LTR42_006628 [Elasticomyces elasticus]